MMMLAVSINCGRHTLQQRAYKRWNMANTDGTVSHRKKGARFAHEKFKGSTKSKSSYVIK
jgi:hypothetical protein